MADTIGVMYLGKLVEVGSGDDIYRRPAHHYTAALIAAVPEPDPTRTRPSSSPPTCEVSYRARSTRPRAAGSARGAGAQLVCAQEEPPLRLFGAGHMAACHFPLFPLVEDDGGTGAGATAAAGAGSALP